MVKRTTTPCSSVEFFKVFLSRLSSHQLSLPPAFVAQLNGTVPKRATLRDHTGKVWDIKLEKTERKLIIREGWQEFASHHSLVDADFLVFNYDGRTHFFVKVYDRNGLKKGKAITHVKEEIETEEGKTRNQSTSGCKRKFSETATRPTQTSGGQSKRSQSMLRQTRGRKPEKCQFTGPQPYVEPKNPHFVTIMTKTSRYSLYVHRSVVKEHNIKLQEDMKLRDENGKLWPVELIVRNDGRVIIHKGWRDFCRKHNVALRDMCIFEFIPADANVIQVHVVRRKSQPPN